jgi:hypothetical protein
LDDTKKPGPRDISDLKARLGLKKQTGVMPAVVPNTTPAQGQPAATGPGSVPAPIPSPTSRAVPAPFGTPEPPAAPAAPPDPRRDPFAQQQAANLAAFYGVGQVLPGSSEGVSDAPISKPKPWGQIGVFVIAGGLLFGVGNACGRIYSSRVEFNQTIDQAGRIREEVDSLAKQLNKIADVINASKETQKGNVDFEMTQALGALELKKPDTQKIFHTNYMHFEDPAIERLFTYYDHTIQLYDQITLHAKKTDADKDAINNYVKNGAGKGDKNYGVTLDLTGAIPLAHFVELGSPVCPQPDQTDCPPAQLKGFKYRMDSGGAWGDKPIKGKPGDTVTPIQPSALFKSVAAGNPDILAYKDYIRRIVSIKGLAGSLVAEQKDVLGDLKKSAERPKVFTF